MKRRRLLASLSALAVAVLGLAVISGARSVHVEAAISCAPHANTSEELDFVVQLQSWRDANIDGSFPLTRSVSLNAAAWHYARFLADTPGAAGHWAEPGYTSGYPWAQRSIDCGYDVPAGAEGLAVVESSRVIDVSSSQAVAIMASEPGGGIHVPANVGADVKCVGAAKAISADGTKVAWVTLLMATWTECADPDYGGGGGGTGGGGEATPTSTSTTTATPTHTPTPSPTPTPTPVANYGASIQICPGWNLVTLPVSGPIDDIFDTAESNISAIYRSNGEAWQRWSPDVPAYARNLSQAFAGDVMWIYGTDAECEQLPV